MATNTFEIPVTLAQYEALKTNQRRLHDVIEILDKMDNCGMACDTIRAAATNAVQQMQDIEREFFTPPPER